MRLLLPTAMRLEQREAWLENRLDIQPMKQQNMNL
jgi:hypothetical protein